jgi:hypothetical protein
MREIGIIQSSYAGKFDAIQPCARSAGFGDSEKLMRLNAKGKLGLPMAADREWTNPAE